MEPVRSIRPSQLDVVKRVAVPLEEKYMLQYMDLKLKKKYRPSFGAYPQFGCGGDWSGKTGTRAKTASSKVKQEIKTMRVDGLTGKALMVAGT